MDSGVVTDDIQNAEALQVQVAVQGLDEQLPEAMRTLKDWGRRVMVG